METKVFSQNRHNHLDGICLMVHIMRRAADEVVAILQDPSKKKAMGEHNYAVGKQFFGLDTLERLIKRFLVNAGVK